MKVPFLNAIHLIVVLYVAIWFGVLVREVGIVRDAAGAPR